MSTSKMLFEASSDLAARITRAASSQTHATIRFLVDRERVSDAYRAYAYFRWLDDQLDQTGMEKPDRLAFVERQSKLIEASYRGAWFQPLTEEETLLVDLIRGNCEPYSGLHSYIDHMLAVMAFDAERRDRLISRDELAEYTHHLAVAVTEAMHYFIGHNCKTPQGEVRYLAVSAAHITHMLRDTLEDVQAGYFNIPREILQTHGIDPRDVESEPYRRWIQERVGQARAYFRLGREYLTRVENPRCRLAGHAYSARFEGVLAVMEQDGYHLRAAYPECKGLAGGSKMIWSALLRTFNHRPVELPQALPIR